MTVVRERNRPRFDHVAKFGEFLPLLIFRHGTDDADMDDANILCSLDETRDKRSIIHDRPCVRHRCNRGIAARRPCA